MYKAWLDDLFDAVYVVDNNRKITYWNKAAEELTGFAEIEVVGSLCSDNILRHVDLSGEEICKSTCPLHRTLNDGKKREATVFLHHKQGHRVPVHIRISPVRNDDGEIIGAIEIFVDHSRDLHIIKEMEQHKRESMLDPLLKIGNRRYAEMIFQVRYFELKMMGNTFGMMFVDIDQFKSVNDTFGHLVGDRVLKMISRTTANLLRDFDTIVRWGGDEFLICLPNVNTKEKLYEITERLKKIVNSCFLIVNDEKVSVTVSIGATLITLKDTFATAVKRVDKLMYKSKAKGGNQWTIG